MAAEVSAHSRRQLSGGFGVDTEEEHPATSGGALGEGGGPSG